MTTTNDGPEFCECAQCEFDEPDADLGYLLYVDPDYLTKWQATRGGDRTPPQET